MTQPIVITRDARGAVRGVTAEDCNRLGYSLDALVGSGLERTVPAAQLAGDLRFLKSCLEAGTVARFASHRVDAAAHTFPVLVTLTPILRATEITGVVETIDVLSRAAREGEEARPDDGLLELREAARQQSDRLETIANTVPGAIFALRVAPDGGWTFPYASARIAEIFGVSSGELTREGGLALARILPDDLPSVLASLSSAIESLAPWRHEFRVEHPARGLLWVEVHAVPERGPDDATVLTGTLLDISQRKASELELTSYRERLNLALENGGMGTFLWDIESGTTWHDDAYLKLVGRVRGEMPLAEDAALQLVHPDDRGLVIATMESILQGGVEKSGVRFRALRPDGEERWLSTQGTVQRDDLGRPLRMTGLCTDVTARVAAEDEARRADAELKASEARFRQLAGAIREVFWLAAPSGAPVSYVSPAYEATWGRSSAELYASPRGWADSVHPDDRAAREQAMRHNAAAGTFDHEYRIVRPDGSVRWIRDRAFPVKDAAGQLVALAGVADDVTERRELEAELRQTQKLESVGLLAGGIAHEFNNWLTVIGGCAELLDDRAPPALRPLIEDIRGASERAAGLTRQLLAFSRRDLPATRLLDPNVLLTDTESMLRRLLGEDVELCIVPAPDAAQVRLDPGQWTSVLMNLCINARDAMPRGGKLELSIRMAELDGERASSFGIAPGRYVLLTVADTGTGMSPEVQSRIFEPFFTTKGVGRGTGLGLSVIHGVVQQAGGHIAVDSAPEVGTTFRIYIPAAPSPARAPATEVPPKALDGSETLLLVEDEDALRRVMQRALSAHGYTVLAAANGEEALALASASPRPIDLLITDVVMPGMNGREVANAVLARFPGTGVLFTSGYTDDEVVRNGIEDADVHFLAKPYTPQLLLRRIRELLTRGSVGSSRAQAPGR
jgi:PAS domain S-box-containing protein